MPYRGDSILQLHYKYHLLFIFSFNTGSDPTAKFDKIYTPLEPQQPPETPYEAEATPLDRKKTVALPPASPAFVIHFRGVMQGLAIRAVLLPSLEAQYKVH